MQSTLKQKHTTVLLFLMLKDLKKYNPHEASAFHQPRLTEKRVLSDG